MKNILKQSLSSPLALFCLLLSALLPSVFCTVHYFQARSELELLEGRLSAIQAHTSFIKRIKNQEAERLAQLKKADPAYLEKQLESLVFLEGRCSERNALRLIEHSFRTKPPFQESDVRLEHSVEMDAEDLKKMLARIEEAQAPELSFKQFTLTRKSSSSQVEAYQINFELLKRELIK